MSGGAYEKATRAEERGSRRFLCRQGKEQQEEMVGLTDAKVPLVDTIGPSMTDLIILVFGWYEKVCKLVW
jgi:hypothetical protein